MPALITGCSILKADRAAKCVRMTLVDGGRNRLREGARIRPQPSRTADGLLGARASLGHASKNPSQCSDFSRVLTKLFAREQ